MPIDKRIPRVLNSDLDSKTSERVSMEDAQNKDSGHPPSRPSQRSRWRMP